MELLIISIVLGSLLLAVFMSVVAWRLLREGRTRSSARVAALEALALSESDDPDDLDAPPVRVRARPLDYDDPIDEIDERDEVDAPAQAFDEPDDVDAAGDRENEDAGEGADWDLAIRPAHQEPAHQELEAEPEPARVRLTVRRPAPPRGRPRRRAAAMHADLFASALAEPLRPRRQGLAAVFMAVAVLVLGTGAVYALRSAPSLADVARRITGPNAASIQPLELLSLKQGSDPTGTFTVTGLVQNPVEGASLTNIVAVVYLFDAEGRYFASGRATIERSSFRPGEESPFVVEVPRAGLVSRYRVGFRFEDGGVVAHVDHRGELPRGTSGGAVNDVDTGEGRLPAAPHRVEG
jgi:hypothetical protein